MSDLDPKPKSGEYNDGRLWFNRKAKTLTIGVTASGLEQVGDIESLECPEEGEDFEKGEIMATIEGGKGTLEVVAPATGAVVDVNQEVHESPELVMDDPLEEGWLIKLEIQDTTDLQELD